MPGESPHLNSTKTGEAHFSSQSIPAGSAHHNKPIGTIPAIVPIRSRERLLELDWLKKSRSDTCPVLPRVESAKKAAKVSLVKST